MAHCGLPLYLTYWQLCVLISGASALSKSSLNMWKLMVHILLKPDLENFAYYFASM